MENLENSSLSNFSEHLIRGTVSGYNLKHRLFLQNDYQDGYNLVVTFHGDGNRTDNPGTGSLASIEQVLRHNNNNDANYSNLILGINPDSSKNNNEKALGNLSYVAIEDMSSIIDNINSTTEPNTQVDNLSFEMFSGGGNLGIVTVEDILNSDIGNAYNSNNKASVTLNDAPIDLNLFDEIGTLKDKVSFLLVGDIESEKWVYEKDKIYANAKDLAKAGFEVQYVEYDPTPEEIARYKAEGLNWDHTGIDEWSKEHDLHLYHAGLVDEPNNPSELEGKVHTFKLFNDGETIPEGYEIVETYVDNDGNTVLLCEKIGGVNDLYTYNESGSNHNVSSTGDIITNSQEFVNSFVTNLTTCISRASKSIKPVVVSNDVTGIGGFINEKIASFNTMTLKLYSDLKAEAIALHSYGDAFEVNDEAMANDVGYVPIDNYDPASEDETNYE